MPDDLMEVLDNKVDSAAGFADMVEKVVGAIALYFGKKLAGPFIMNTLKNKIKGIFGK